MSHFHPRNSLYSSQCPISLRNTHFVPKAPHFYPQLTHFFPSSPISPPKLPQCSSAGAGFPSTSHHQHPGGSWGSAGGDVSGVLHPGGPVGHPWVLTCSPAPAPGAASSRRPRRWLSPHPAARPRFLPVELTAAQKLPALGACPPPPPPMGAHQPLGHVLQQVRSVPTVAGVLPNGGDGHHRLGVVPGQVVVAIACVRSGISTPVVTREGDRGGQGVPCTHRQRGGVRGGWWRQRGGTWGHRCPRSCRC